MYTNEGVLFSANTWNKFTISEITTPAMTTKYVITTAVRGLQEDDYHSN